MNVLSGRSVYQTGSVSINGRVVEHWKPYMAKIAYVQQDDVFFGDLTVRDQLTYTALLRLKEHAQEQTEHVLKLLRLNKVADAPIRTISGGERKRVNIGTELLTDPPVILLDEPTSGLDATTAISLLRLLKDLAVNQGKTIVTSVHQPNSKVFRSFDKLIMLSNGNVVYFGDPVDSIMYLEKLQLACPEAYNCADHWMDLLVAHPDDDDEYNDEYGTEAPPREILERAWDDSTVESLIIQGDPREIPQHTQKYKTGWCTQYRILTHRALKNSRSAIFTPLNLCKSLAIGIVAGLVWFDTEYTEQNINDIRAFFFFTMTFWVFDSMFTALAAFPAERHVILRERASGSYRLSCYFLAKTTADAPVRLILPFLYMIVSFWMARVSTSFAEFCGSVGCTLLSVVAGEALGLFIGAAVYDLQKGLTIMTVSTLFLMLLGGFFVENVPEFIEWGKFLSPFKYAFDSSLQIVFSKPMPCDGSGALEDLCLGDAESVSVSDLKEFMGIQGSVAFNVGMLLIICTVPRYFAYVALRYKKSGER